MRLIDISTAFSSDEKCLTYLENKRWPNGVRCTTCGADKISKITRKSKTKNKRAQLYQCLEPSCKQQFSATTGTIFHDSHLPLSKWFSAIALIVDAKKGKSALELSRNLKCNYRTAWYLSHRIREAMTDPDGLKLTGTVEMDETYIGGKERGRGAKKNKEIVLGLRQRGGPLRLIHVADIKQDTLYNAIVEKVDPKVEKIMTDDSWAYNFRLTQFRNAKHKRVNHSRRQWIKGE